MEFRRVLFRSFGETPDHRSRHHSTRNDSQIPSVMLRRVRPMIRYGGAVCIALGLATGPARAEAGTTAPQIELVISAVADPDASGAAYVELRLLNSGSASETMTLPRSEERRLGQEWVRTVSTRGSP